MGFKIRKFRQLDYKVWNELYQNNPNISPYQDFEFIKRYIKTCKFSKIRFFLSNDIYLLYNEDKKIICPLTVNHKSQKVYILGDFSAVSYCDFVYSNVVNDDMFDELISTLKTIYTNYELCFNKINENSVLCKYLLKKYIPTTKMSCVKIIVNDNYFNSLSKHSRQNIRTAYNRMKREEKSYRIEFYNKNKRLEFHQKNECMKLYCNRMIEKFGKNTLSYPLLYLSQRFLNPINNCLKKLDNQFHALFYIDGELAAFMSGFYNCDNTRLVVPKLAFNSKYKFYEPGNIMIKETAEYLQQFCNNFELDLSRGDEKYKFAMGGEEHFNYSFII